MGLVPRRAHSPPFKGGVAAQRPGWLVKCPAQRLLMNARPQGAPFLNLNKKVAQPPYEMPARFARAPFPCEAICN